MPCLNVTCLNGFLESLRATCPISCAPLSSRYSVSFFILFTGFPLIFSLSSFLFALEDAFIVYLEF